MRKLEGVVKEIVDELSYLQKREMRMRDTNGENLRSQQLSDGKNQRTSESRTLLSLCL
jgi:hypothetical protein